MRHEPPHADAGFAIASRRRHYRLPPRFAAAAMPLTRFYFDSLDAILLSALFAPPFDIYFDAADAIDAVRHFARYASRFGLRRARLIAAADSFHFRHAISSPFRLPPAASIRHAAFADEGFFDY